MKYTQKIDFLYKYYKIYTYKKMIIPIRCFTCGHVIADKWNYYLKKVEELENSNVENKKNDEKDFKYFQAPFKEKVLDELELKKYCCRRMFLTHVDIVDNL